MGLKEKMELLDRLMPAYLRTEPLIEIERDNLYLAPALTLDDEVFLKFKKNKQAIAVPFEDFVKHIGPETMKKIEKQIDELIGWLSKVWKHYMGVVPPTAEDAEELKSLFLRRLDEDVKKLENFLEEQLKKGGTVRIGPVTVSELSFKEDYDGFQYPIFLLNNGKWGDIYYILTTLKTVPYEIFNYLEQQRNDFSPSP